jgi:NAD(P)-dependent dehydrogenase (short-subunit alcohol dehydrogenase family)
MRPLVTGASRGIGRAFVDEFLAAGCEKIYAGVRDAAAAERLRALDPRIIPVELDTTLPEHVAAVATACTDVTLLVNNAGVEMQSAFLGAQDMRAARHEMDVNYFGTLAMTRAFAPTIVRARGAIVNILSISALVTIPHVGSYSASKQAARALTQGIRAELKAQGVRVLAVYPTGYDTDMAAASVKDRSVLFPPRLLTGKVLKALQDGGDDEIYPDPNAEYLGRLAREDPDQLAALFAAH